MMRTLIITWLIGYTGVRVGEASNPGPENSFRIGFGNVSSMILHQDYLNTVPCDVFGLCETRLNDTGIRLIQDSLRDLNWTFTPGKAQPQRRPGVDGRYLDAMPGGVGFMVKGHIPFVRTSLLLDDYTEEESRRIVAITIVPEDGMTPIRIYQVYGFARAKDDPERYEINERFLTKIFEEADSCRDIPVVIIGDINIDPSFSTAVSERVISGRWVDAGTVRAGIENTDPPWTFSQRDMTSRIDVALLNESAMNLFSGFEQWSHEHCTIPNHKMQCVTLRLAGRKQFGMKPKIPRSIPTFGALPKEDSDFILDELFEEYMDKLSVSFENGDVQCYWFWWCRIAEQWLIRYCAYATADQSLLEDDKYLGRGIFHLEKTQVNKTRKEVTQEGNSVDPRLASALKIVRLLDEIIIKRSLPRSFSLDTEIHELWLKASRIAWSDCKIQQTMALRSLFWVPDGSSIKGIRCNIQKFINDRGAQLRKLRLHKLRAQAAEKFKQNPASAFECLRPELETPLAAIKRSDGSLTGNINEMDSILRDKWSAVFCKHKDGPPPPEIDPFMEKYGGFIKDYPMNLEAITVSDIRSRLRKCKDTGATGLDGWAPRDFKRLPDEILELLCCFYDLIESVGEWPNDLTHAAVSLIPKNEGYDPMNMRPISVLPIAYRIWAAVRCKHCTLWQESWITQGQHGCRRGHGTSDALLRLSGELECAFLEGCPDIRRCARFRESV